ncbi:MAG: hypothetical protein QM496_03585 [Verrucomicrobiota bacterium]
MNTCDTTPSPCKSTDQPSRTLPPAVTCNGRRRIEYGLNGLFYSLPEIIGISIRKERPDILPQDQSPPPPGSTPAFE